MKIAVATIVALSTLSLGAAKDLDVKKRRTYGYGGGGGGGTKVARLECASAYPDTFTSYIALATKNGKGDMGDSLRDAYRIGTATECDPFQRSLKDADLICDEKSATDKYVSLELYEVKVASYGTPSPETALEEYDDTYPVDNEQMKSIFCTLDAITSNDATGGRCPRYGCYCPKDLLDAEATTGLTEEELAMLLNEQSVGYGGYGGYGYGGKSGKSGKKGGSTVVDVAELRAFPCEGPTILETDFQFITTADNICKDLSAKELDVFADEFIRLSNLAQFNGCDGAFRRLKKAEPVTNCEKLYRRNLQFSDIFLNSTFGLSSLFEEFTSPDRTNEQFSGDVRRRGLVEDQPQNLVEKYAPSLLSSAFDLVSNNGGQQDDSTHRGLPEEGPTSSMFDYGGAFNFKDGMCFCSAFSDTSSVGITEEGLTDIANRALLFATGGDFGVEEAVELEDDDCGLPKVFTERVSVKAGGFVGKKYYYQTYEDAILNGLAELIVKVIQDLADSCCVSTYLEIVDITLAEYDAKKPNTYKKYSMYDWSLEFDIQYVMFGVVDEKDANLFDGKKRKKKRGLEEAAAEGDGEIDSVMDDSEIDVSRIMEAVDSPAGSMRHDARLAYYPDEVDVFFQLQDLNTVLDEADCSCDPTRDVLKLMTINKHLHKAINMGAVPGLDHATIKD